jgi:hypothetical protein
MGGGLLVLGLAIVGVAQLRAHIGRRVSSIAWIVAFVAAIATVIPGVASAAFAVTGVALGLAFIAAGVELWSAKGHRASATPGSLQ